jgi:hypothetical protein
MEYDIKTFRQFCEDGGAAGVASGVAANSTGPDVAGTGDDKSTVVVKKKPKIITRTKPE